MKHTKPVWTLLTFISLTTLSFSLSGAKAVNGQMNGMREMMQRMMPGSLPPGIAPNLLPKSKSKAVKLLTHYCTQCHNLPGPGMHTAGEWPAVIKRMETRMAMHNNMMGGVLVPTASELTSIQSYLRNHAMQPIDTSDYTDLNSPGGRAFGETCAQCHALPDPKLHTLNEWPTVVKRMQKNISAMGKPAPKKQKLINVIEFLQRHARVSK